MKTEIIGFIAKAGYKLLKIYEDEHNPDDLKKHSWWVVEDWRPANDTGEEGETYSQVRGMEVTDFININHITQNEIDFISKFSKFVDKAPVLVCDFHKDFKWKMYNES